MAFYDGLVNINGPGFPAPCRKLEPSKTERNITPSSPRKREIFQRWPDNGAKILFIRYAASTAAAQNAYSAYYIKYAEASQFGQIIC